jgi:hypothetical protein
VLARYRLLAERIKIMPRYPLASFCILHVSIYVLGALTCHCTLMFLGCAMLCLFFSSCSDHRTAHMYASHTFALCAYHTNPYCTVICSLCVLGNTFSLAICHKLVAARGALGSCDQYNKLVYKSLRISPGRLLNLLLDLR